MLDLHERRASHSGIIPRSAPRYPTADTQHARVQIHPYQKNPSEFPSSTSCLASPRMQTHRARSYPGFRRSMSTFERYAMKPVSPEKPEPFRKCAVTFASILLVLAPFASHAFAQSQTAKLADLTAANEKPSTYKTFYLSNVTRLQDAIEIQTDL